MINSHVRTMDELGLPERLKLLTRYQNGLILATGSVGTGKSTTLAAMVEQVNMERRDHIITLEDPIEYILTSKNCHVTQREIFTHSDSFATALRFGKIPMSSWLEKCAIWKRFHSPSRPRKPATLFLQHCIPAVRLARLIDCSTYFRLTNRNKSE